MCLGRLLIEANLASRSIDCPQVLPDYTNPRLPLATTSFFGLVHTRVTHCGNWGRRPMGITPGGDTRFM